MDEKQIDHDKDEALTVNDATDAMETKSEAAEETDSSATDVAQEAAGENAAVDESGELDPDSIGTPQFQELTATNNEVNPGSDVNRLREVKVVLSAELGRTKIRIGELLSLLEGSVIELNKTIESPVELIAQGVPLGNGEVVVVDDCFAIRIKEIYSNSQANDQF